MANKTLAPYKGHPSAELTAFEHGNDPDIMSPELLWECLVTHDDVGGAHSTQRTVLTIPALDFVTGRATATFTGGGLGAPVTTFADAAVGDTEEDLATALATEIDDLIATTLDGVVAAVLDNGGDVEIDFVPGIARVSVAFSYAPAQQTTITWGGALVDGEYSIDIEPGAGFDDVNVPNDRAAASPVDAAAMAAAFETTAEALIATTLADVLVSANDAGAVNTLVFEPGIAATVTANVTVNRILTFAGTATDGTYLTRLQHVSLPGGVLDVPIERSGGSSNTNLADAFEADVEARALLAPLLVNANNTAGANTLTFYPGVTGLSVTAVSAPAPGTLAVTGPTVVVEDATPAGPVVTVAHSFAINLNDLASNREFPAPCLRGESPVLRVLEAWPAGATATLDDGGTASTDVLTAVAIDATGWVGDTSTSLGDAHAVELSWDPVLTIALGSSPTPTIGELKVQVTHSPLPE